MAAVATLTSALPFDVDISMSEPGWGELLEDPEPFVTRAVAAGLSVLETAPQGELSIAFVSDEEIASLNATYRAKDGPTNVLSFPSTGPAPVQGDIVLALQTCLREAGTRGIDARDHATHLLVHGFLHLQGYDHMDTAEAEIMEALERDALSTLAISDPYVLTK